MPIETGALSQAEKKQLSALKFPKYKENGNQEVDPFKISGFNHEEFYYGRLPSGDSLEIVEDDSFGDIWSGKSKFYIHVHKPRKKIDANF